VIFALFSDGPAIFPVVAFGPPAIKDAAIGLSVEGGFLSGGDEGLVGTYRIVESEVCA